MKIVAAMFLAILLTGCACQFDVAQMEPIHVAGNLVPPPDADRETRDLMNPYTPPTLPLLTWPWADQKTEAK